MLCSFGSMCHFGSIFSGFNTISYCKTKFVQAIDSGFVSSWFTSGNIFVHKFFKNHMVNHWSEPSSPQTKLCEGGRSRHTWSHQSWHCGEEEDGTGAHKMELCLFTGEGGRLQLCLCCLPCSLCIATSTTGSHISSTLHKGQPSTEEFAVGFWVLSKINGQLESEGKLQSKPQSTSK